MKRITALLLTLLLALSLVACGSKEVTNTTQDTQVENTETNDNAATTEDTDVKEDTSDSTDSNVLGEGETAFTFVVTDLDGKETSYEIHTDAATVGEALVDLGLVEGDEGEYGLYVNTVNGITADWDADQTYWAFYIDGEYAMTGVDSTDVTAGTTYSFVLTAYVEDTTSDATSDVTILGEGETVFTFIVADLDGNETNYEIHTDAATVGEALLALELIAGDVGEYGLYVTEVTGMTADWDADQTYWAFYIDGEYAMTGVDATEITAGATYSFVLTKG